MIILGKVLLSAVIMFSMVTVFILLANSATHYKYNWLDKISDSIAAIYLKLAYIFLIGLFIGVGALLIWSVWTQM